jgi:hypothetical protein
MYTREERYVLLFFYLFSSKQNDIILYTINIMFASIFIGHRQNLLSERISIVVFNERQKKESFYNNLYEVKAKLYLLDEII